MAEVIPIGADRRGPASRWTPGPPAPNRPTNDANVLILPARFVSA